MGRTTPRFSIARKLEIVSEASFIGNISEVPVIGSYQIARKYQISTKSIRDWRKSLPRFEAIPVRQKSICTLNAGRKRQWEHEEARLVERVRHMRALGVGISSTLLFGFMSEQVPEFAEKTENQKWSWYTSFMKKHNLSMRRPNRRTGLFDGEEDEIKRCFITHVQEQMRIHMVGKTLIKGDA